MLRIRIPQRLFQTTSVSAIFNVTGIPVNLSFLPAPLLAEAASLPDVQEADRLVSVGKFADAVSHLDRARDIFASLPNLPVVLPLHLRRAKLFQYQGQFEQELSARQDFLHLLSNSFSLNDAPNAFVYGVSSLSLSMLRNKLYFEASGLCDYHFHEFGAASCSLGMVFCDIINAVSMGAITNAPISDTLLTRATENCASLKDINFERSSALISAGHGA
jgi:hypothetical protein